MEDAYSGEPSEIVTSEALPEKQSCPTFLDAFLQKLETIPVLRRLTPVLRAILCFFEQRFHVQK